MLRELMRKRREKLEREILKKYWITVCILGRNGQEYMVIDATIAAILNIDLVRPIGFQKPEDFLMQGVSSMKIQKGSGRA